MTYVRNTEGQWQRWDGQPAEFTKLTTEAVIRRHDGTEEITEVEPYEVRLTLALTPALDLWSDEELAEVGLARAVPFEAPEGKVAVGEPTYTEVEGQVIETYDIEDAPPPPPAPTPAEKLAAAGLTVEELRELLAEGDA